MTIQWHSNHSQPSSVVFFRKKGDLDWRRTEGGSESLDSLDYLVHRTDLSELIPATEYEFFLEGSQWVHSFRTLPSQLSEKTVKIVIGGDVFLNARVFRKMNAVVSSYDPDLIILGGDIAYAEKFKKYSDIIGRWKDFFQIWNQTIRGSSGRLIPMVACPGNHDVNILHEPSRQQPFYTFFTSDKSLSYRSIDIGDYCSFFLLDSGHLHKVEAEQTLWLEQALYERQKVSFKHPVYHVAAYSCYYFHDKKNSASIRQHWCPLFEDYGVQIAFEHHSHAYKRTYPLLHGAIDPLGVIYVGDGCWGVPLRRTQERGYLEKRESINCFNVLSMNAEGERVSVISIDDQLIDTFFVPKR